jgi:outer membrane protein TolC
MMSKASPRVRSLWLGNDQLRRAARMGLMPAVAAGLCACATFSPDGGMAVVAELASADLGKGTAAIRTAEDAAAARVAVERLLRRSLTADAAVQVALINNRGLQAAYNELGVAEAVLVGSSLPPNPTFSLFRISGSGAFEIERQIAADIVALATLPARSDIAAQRFRQAQLRAAEETLRLAAEVRRAYYRAVAARELVRLLTRAKATADTTAELAARLGKTGALSKLDQAREQVFYAETTAELATLNQEAASARERLVRLLGLWGRDSDLRLPDALPTLPARAQTLPAIEADAVGRRVDLQIARIELAALARSLELTEATRFIDLLDVAGVAKTAQEPGGQPFGERGLSAQLKVPIFDFGAAKVREAEQIYMKALNRLVERAINVRSEARDAYRTYRSAYDIALHYRREILPLRKIIADETQLRFGAMQIDVFALLAEARQGVAASRAGIEAKRDFWLAEADLKAAVVGGGLAGVRGRTAPPTPSAQANTAEN